MNVTDLLTVTEIAWVHDGRELTTAIGKGVTGTAPSRGKAPRQALDSGGKVSAIAVGSPFLLTHEGCTGWNAPVFMVGVSEIRHVTGTTKDGRAVSCEVVEGWCPSLA